MDTNDLITSFTPTGRLPTKAMSAYVTVGVAEIVEDVHQAVELGITMVHVCASDEATGKPTYHL